MQIQKNHIIQSYSIISAVYNVAPYLHKYFKTLINQSLSFNQHIQLILIDDGSTDKSSDIIKDWVKKYPENIHYVKKENGGQASARNLGLEYVKTPWVTFIDPDDFVDKHYFEMVDNTIHKYASSDLSMIGCNILYYFEKFRLTLDRHPLKYKFQADNVSCLVKDLNENIQLSASAAFFRTDLIQATQLKFDTKIKPNFEDVHFVNAYLIENPFTSVCFLKKAIYYYRRRKIKNSTLDKAWEQKELYDDVLKFGCLDLFEKANTKFGYIPKFLQKTILYHLSWYFKYIVDHPEVVAFLSDEEQEIFQRLLKRNFDSIDSDVIGEFNLSGIDEMIKQGWMHMYKHSTLPDQMIALNKQRHHLKMYYYSQEEKTLHLQIDNVNIPTPKAIVQTHTFLNKTFIHAYQMELPFTHTMKNISLQVESSPSYLKTGNRKYFQDIEIVKIENDNRRTVKQLLYNIARKMILGK